MLEAIKDTSVKLSDDIESLARQMSYMRIDESSLDTLCTKFQATHSEDVQALVFQIETSMAQQEAIRISSDLGRTDAVRKKILISLAFSEMDSRQNQIEYHEAMENTFDWVLDIEARKWEGSLETFSSWMDNPTPPFPIFWVSGKPGSGKSTLLHFLKKTIDRSSCPHWVHQSDLFICSYFLWNAGGSLQKSFQGLLRAILFQILLRFKWLTEIAVSDQRLFNVQEADSFHNDWPLPELKKLLLDCLSLIEVSHKVFLLLDGLDEIQGNDRNRTDMLIFLRTLSMFKSVKL